MIYFIFEIYFCQFYLSLYIFIYRYINANIQDYDYGYHSIYTLHVVIRAWSINYLVQLFINFGLSNICSSLLHC